MPTPRPATAGVMLRRLVRWLPDDVAAVLARLRDLGGHPMLVGGAVRAAALGQAPADWDIAIDLPAARVSAAFPRIVTGGAAARHDTVMVLTGVGAVEVTTLRGPRHADWRQALVHDLALRDFTVNAMAADLAEMRLFDPFAGRADLGRGIIRAVGDAAARLHEDPLRLVRAARLLAHYGWRLAAATRAALAPAVADLAGVAWERQRAEMLTLLAGPACGRALLTLAACGALHHLAPPWSTGRPRLTWLARLPANDPWLRLVGWAWAASSTPSQLTEVCQRWGAGAAATRRLQAILSATVPLRSATALGALARRKMLAAAPHEAVMGAARLAGARWPSTHATLERQLVRTARLAATRVADLRIDGDTVRGLGLRGDAVGRVLRELLAWVVENPRRNRPRVLLAEAMRRSRAQLGVGAR